jgi:hypothetical protein
MESIHIKAKDYSNIFVEGNMDDDDQQEVFLSIHIIGGHCCTSMSREAAMDLIKALEAILATEAK